VFNNEDFLCAFLRAFLNFLCTFVLKKCKQKFQRFKESKIVKAIILVTNNTPQKTYRVAQYTGSQNRLNPIVRQRSNLKT
jgi:hypothetical protein